MPCPVIASNLHRHTRVAQARPRQAVERRNVLRHLVEQTFDGQETILAGDVVNQIVQEIPFGRASPGGSTAFMNFCTRPLVFVNVPRFSAWAQPGKT